MCQKLYGLDLELRHYIDQTPSLVKENQRLSLTLQATSSALDDYKAAAQQENALSQSYKYKTEEWRLEATGIREELASTRQELQGAECRSNAPNNL